MGAPRRGRVHHSADPADRKATLLAERACEIFRRRGDSTGEGHALHGAYETGDLRRAIGKPIELVFDCLQTVDENSRNRPWREDFEERG